MTTRHRLYALRRSLRETFWGPQILAFLPAICLGAYWIVGEGGLITVALGLPFVWGALGGFQTRGAHRPERTAPQHVLPDARIATQIEGLVSEAQPEDRCAIFALSLENADTPLGGLPDEVVHELRDQMARRLKSMLRAGDKVFLAGHLDWIIALHPGPRFDLEVAIQQASRLQNTTDEPFIIDAVRHYFTATVGFKLVRPATETDMHHVLSNARGALKAALLSGPGSVRAYKAELAQEAPSVSCKPAPVATGQITAWYQPQISTDTGAVSGFEALARLNDPKKGILPPAAFLPAMEQAGQLEHLSEVMLAQSLSALKTWDEGGLQVETVGVNYAAQDLSNPKLYEKIAWELDRHDVAPHRLCIEVLETVIASGNDDITTRNVTKLADLGCQIDLDDFGTGHASISTLRRLPVARLKIDRSFVARSDLDPEQQKMVATIVMMAERLGLTTLAEGVETVGEHAILAQLGCRFVQGYGIAKPMPLEETVDWVSGYQSRLARSPSIDRKTG